MTRRTGWGRALLGVAVGLAAGTALGLGPGAPHSQAAGIETAWWSQQGANPSVPEGGLYVSQLPNIPGLTGPGADPTKPPEPFVPYAIAALRFAAPQGADVTLTLKVSTGSSAQNNGEAVGLQACAARDDTAPWLPNEGNGAWADRATPDCDSFGNAVSVASDGTTISFSLPSAFQRTPGLLDIVLVPSGDPYSLSLDKPSEADIASSGGDADTPGGGDFTAPPPTDPPPPTFDDPTAGVGGGGDIVNVPPPGDTIASPEGGALPEAPADTPAGDTAPTTIARDDGLVARTPVAAGPARGGRATSDTGPRVAALAGLALLGGGLFWMSGQTTRRPQLLGSVGGAAGAEEARRLEASEAAREALEASARGTGGVGRFARPRQGVPRGLR